MYYYYSGAYYRPCIWPINRRVHRDRMAIHPCLRLPLTHHSTTLLHHARTKIYTRPGTLPPHMRTNRTCNLVLLILLLIGARLALSPTLAAGNTAMAMAMVVTDDDVGLVRGGS